MKRIFALLVLAEMLLTPLLQGEEKYADVRRVVLNNIAILERYIASMKQARNAEEVAAALNVFGDEIARIIPIAVAFEKRYPELKDTSKVPAALKKLIDRADTLSAEASRVGDPVIQRYEKYPVVRKAYKELFGKIASDGGDAGRDKSSSPLTPPKQDKLPD